MRNKFDIKALLGFAIVITVAIIKNSIAVDCKDVLCYYCPFDGFNVPQNALRHPKKDNFIVYGAGNSTGKLQNLRNVNSTKATAGSIFCVPRSLQSAYFWLYNVTQYTIDNTSSNIVSNHRFLYFDNFTNLPHSDYKLNMFCELNRNETLPKTLMLDQDAPAVSWKPFGVGDSDVKSCLETGQNNGTYKASYVGLTVYKGKMHAANIILGSAWLEILDEDYEGRPVYVTYAREVKMLCSEDTSKFKWLPKPNPYSDPSTYSFFTTNYNIYRCNSSGKYLLTLNLELCRGKPIDILHREDSPYLVQSKGNPELWKRSYPGKVRCKYVHKTKTEIKQEEKLAKKVDERKGYLAFLVEMATKIGAEMYKL